MEGARCLGPMMLMPIPLVIQLQPLTTNALTDAVIASRVLSDIEMQKL